MFLDKCAFLPLVGREKNTLMAMPKIHHRIGQKPIQTYLISGRSPLHFLDIETVDGSQPPTVLG